jgi:hypothetical protein
LLHLTRANAEKPYAGDTQSVKRGFFPKSNVFKPYSIES